MISVFESIYLPFSQKKIVEASAYTRWPWSKDVPLTRAEVEHALENGCDASTPRGQELAKILYIIKNFDITKAKITGEVFDNDLLINDGNHTLAAMLYLGINPLIEVVSELCPSNDNNIKNSLYRGRNIISFDEIALEFTFSDDAVYVNNLFSGAVGNCYFYRKLLHTILYKEDGSVINTDKTLSKNERISYFVTLLTEKYTKLKEYYDVIVKKILDETE